MFYNVLCSGTHSDICIKPIDIKEDLYLPIQIKTTEKFSHGFYSYSISGRTYENMLLILICLTEDKIWIINDTENINLKGKLNITKKSKYKKYFMKDNNNINKILLKYYNTLNYNNNYDTINLPITLECQLEQKYRKLRENNLTFIEFIYGDLRQQVYDFKIYDFKIQEKTVTKRKDRKNSMIVTLHKSDGGKKNQPYELNDNDYYWFHIPDDKLFYVIPENILFNNGFISDKQNNIKGKTTLSLNPYNDNNWTKDYLFSYENLNLFKEKYSEFLQKEDNIELLINNFKQLPFYD
jgi:hypothetical protein